MSRLAEDILLQSLYLANGSGGSEIIIIWQSSNPALNNDKAFKEVYGKKMFADRADVLTVQGVVNKTAILVAIAFAAGIGGYSIIQAGTSMTFVMISCLTAMVVCFGAYMVIHGNPARAIWMAPIYAIVQGVFLGSLSAALDGWLAGMAIAATGGIALQAAIITVSILIAMLALYKLKILKPTQKFVSTVKVLTFGVMIVYLISWPVGLLLGKDLPLIGLTSAFGNGWTPMIGLGINLLILGLASMWLIIDFGMIEEKVEAGAPRHMEWYCGFALLVTLAWIYYEAVKLAFRLAILIGGRD